jgi:hypothetical protein
MPRERSRWLSDRYRAPGRLGNRRRPLSKGAVANHICRKLGVSSRDGLIAQLCDGCGRPPEQGTIHDERGLPGGTTAGGYAQVTQRQCSESSRTNDPSVIQEGSQTPL